MIIASRLVGIVVLIIGIAAVFLSETHCVQGWITACIGFSISCQSYLAEQNALALIESKSQSIKLLEIKKMLKEGD